MAGGHSAFFFPYSNVNNKESEAKAFYDKHLPTNK